MNHERRILVLGCRNVRGATAYEWKDLPTDLNVADWDVLILSYLGEPDQKAFRLRPDGIALMAARETSEVVVLSDGQRLNIARVGGCDVLGFLADPPAFVEASGTTVNVSVAEWEFFFRHVTKTSVYCQIPAGPSPGGTKVNLAGIGHVAIGREEIIPLATERNGHSLGFSTKLAAYGDGRGRLVLGGRVTWLPRPTEISGDEAVALILRERFGIASSSTAPAWTSDFKLPDEESAAEVVQNAETALANALASLAAAQAAAEVAGKWQPLLYEQGEALADLVREALAELGADVPPFEEAYLDDGRFSCPAGRAGLVEIRGKKSNVEKDDITQVADSVHRVFTEEEADVKGVLAINVRRNDSPADRPSSAVGANEIARAKRHRISILTTLQLHSAIGQKQAGTFDADAFWEIVMTTDGLCELPSTGDSR